MGSRFHADEHQVLRLGAGLVGLIFTAAASIAADLARKHMAVLGAICGAGPHPHCGWCYGAASLFLLGLAALAWAVQPRPLASQRAD